MFTLSGCVLAALVVAGAQAQQPQYPVDPQTGRAVGAHEMPAADVARALETNRKVVIIDVREPDSFAKETIKGAINIPLGQLDARLKDFSKDTLLVFT
jgi:3-mercaptopyruvate sulfurtransferase SseA